MALVREALSHARPATAPTQILAPLQSQEVWAAGVTYFRSRDARMAESKDAGGGSFYDRVYVADRPELFFKGTPHRVAAPGTPVRIRADSKWNVPEPELTLAVNAAGKIFGFTAGNDMSSRDIEGENPLYLPQAKVYDRSTALGPCLVVTDSLPGASTAIAIEILRAGIKVFSGETTVGQIKRPLASLAEWLFRENTFPHGCYLMTGTGIVPPDSFTLQRGDEIRITIEPAGTLVNLVA
jgi:2-dehydro-3-deoxy-D-arabinonate dehydratase